MVGAPAQKEIDEPTGKFLRPRSHIAHLELLNTRVQSSRLAGRMGPLAVLVATSMTANAADVASAAQLTSHMGKLKVPELCLAAFTAAWAIDGNARRSSAG
jgi:hypothetical protein